MPAPNLSENVLVATDSVTAGMLSDLSTALNEIQPLAARIADLKKETWTERRQSWKQSWRRSRP